MTLGVVAFRVSGAHNLKWLRHFASGHGAYTPHLGRLLLAWLPPKRHGFLLPRSQTQGRQGQDVPKPLQPQPPGEAEFLEPAGAPPTGAVGGFRAVGVVGQEVPRTSVEGGGA